MQKSLVFCQTHIQVHHVVADSSGMESIKWKNNMFWDLLTSSPKMFFEVHIQDKNNQLGAYIFIYTSCEHMGHNIYNIILGGGNHIGRGWQSEGMVRGIRRAKQTIKLGDFLPFSNSLICIWAQLTISFLCSYVHMQVILVLMTS